MCFAISFLLLLLLLLRMDPRASDRSKKSENGRRLQRARGFSHLAPSMMTQIFSFLSPKLYLLVCLFLSIMGRERCKFFFFFFSHRDDRFLKKRVPSACCRHVSLFSLSSLSLSLFGALSFLMSPIGSLRCLFPLSLSLDSTVSLSLSLSLSPPRDIKRIRERTRVGFALDWLFSLSLSLSLSLSTLSESFRARAR